MSSPRSYNLRSTEYCTATSSEVVKCFAVSSPTWVKKLLPEADQLKEYVIAIEGLGKPSSYDPQQNSAVRIQVGRLRHKLAEYYRGEGKDDQIVVDLPKGRFRLICQHRQSLAEPLPIADSSPAIVPNIRPAGPAVNRRPLFRPVPLSILDGSLLVLLVGGLFAVQTWRVRDAAVVEGLTPELSKLWAPFLKSRRPLIISIEDPLFAEVRSNPGVYFRDRSMNQWKDVVNSPAVKTLTGKLKQTDIQPSRYYTAFGEVDASFMFGMLLGPHAQNLSLVRTSQLSWQQLADNNVIFVGVQPLLQPTARNADRAATDP